MEKFLNIILNPYCFLILAALIIIGLTQLIKLIPCFKNNNWNISFPILFGYCAAFGWALLTKYDIESNIEILLSFGTGIGTLSTTLYSILKKVFSKDYKMTSELQNNELYSFLNNLFAVDIKDFNTKTLTEKYSYVISIASSLTSVVDKLQKKDVEGAKTEIINVLSKFVSTGDISKSADGLLDILKKQYNVPETVVPQVQSLTKPQ